MKLPLLLYIHEACPPREPPECALPSVYHYWPLAAKGLASRVPWQDAKSWQDGIAAR